MNFEIAKYLPHLFSALIVISVLYYICRPIFGGKVSKIIKTRDWRIPETPPNSFLRVNAVDTLTVERILSGYEERFGKERPLSSLSNRDRFVQYQLSIIGLSWEIDMRKDDGAQTKKPLIFEPAADTPYAVNIHYFSYLTGADTTDYQYVDPCRRDWTESQTSLGSDGVYQHITAAAGRQTLVLLEISESTAQYLHAHRLAATDEDTVKLKEPYTEFPLISRDSETGAYYYCIQKSHTARVARGYELIWPLVNMPREVFEAFKELMLAPEAKGDDFYVYNAQGYTHVEFESPTTTLVYSDKTAWFNAEQPTMNQQVGMGTQLLQELEEKITEPGWIAIKPNNEKVIRWYINPILNKE